MDQIFQCCDIIDSSELPQAVAVDRQNIKYISVFWWSQFFSRYKSMEKELVRLNKIRVLLIYCNTHDEITNSKWKDSIWNRKNAKISKMKYYFSLKWNSFIPGKRFWENDILQQFWKLFSALLYNLVIKIENWF